MVDPTRTRERWCDCYKDSGIGIIIGLGHGDRTGAAFWMWSQRSWLPRVRIAPRAGRRMPAAEAEPCEDALYGTKHLASSIELSRKRFRRGVAPRRSERVAHRALLRGLEQHGGRAAPAPRALRRHEHVRLRRD
jgi:hypothetical protein